MFLCAPLDFFEAWLTLFNLIFLDYSQFKHDEVKELTDDSYSSTYDSDKDPLWKIKNNEGI